MRRKAITHYYIYNSATRLCTLLIGSCLMLFSCMLPLSSCMLLLSSCSSDGPENIEPTMHTLEATDITHTSATLNGSISLQGKTAMPQVTFGYGTDALTLTANATVSNDGKAVATISGLSAGTSYQYRLQADNGHAIVYGNTMTFTTVANEKPTIGDASILSQSPTSAIIGFDIADDGGEKVTKCGGYVVEGDVTVLADKSIATAFNGEVKEGIDKPCQVIVSNLKQNTTYTVFPFAVNKMGESLGNAVTFTTSGNAITLANAGDLAKMIDSGTSLSGAITITGPLNGDDLAALRTLPLTGINMADAHIVSGGGSYDGSHYSENNVIGQQLFAGCSMLTEIKLPNDAVRMDNDAFKDCTALKSLTIPASMTKVLPSGGCTALSSIEVSAANASFKSIDGVLTDIDAKDLVWFPMGKNGTYTLPSTITTIGDYAFRDCNIAEVTLPDGLTTMGQGVFFGSKVERVTLSDKLKTVPMGTFQHCSRLKDVHLGASTEQLSSYVFDGCPLIDLYIAATTPPTCNSNTFTTSGSDFTKTCTLHVPKGRARFYAANNYWNVFVHITE